MIRLDPAFSGDMTVIEKAMLRRVYEDLNRILKGPRVLPRATTATLPSATTPENWWASYICTDNNKVAYCDGTTGAWRYYDGSLV